MQRIRIHLSVCLLAFFAVLTAYYYLFRSPPSSILPFVTSSDKEEIRKSLQWYCDNMVGALEPKDSVTIIADPAASFNRDKPVVAFSEKLFESGLFEKEAKQEQGFDHSQRQAIRIGKNVRGSVWWPGSSFPASVFLYSPFRYRVVEVEATVSAYQQGTETLQVRFRWEKAGPSAVQESLVALGLAPAAEAIGAATTEVKEVTFIKSMYGFFLPISREADLSDFRS